MNEVMAVLQLRSKTGSLKRSFNDLLAENLIEYTIPDKPNSRLQKYRLTQIRGLRVMVDADLAMLYEVTTKGLNQAVKRNKDRFPGDFMFQLTREEKLEVVTNCDHLSRLRFSPVLPYVFTEHGVLMLANILNSERAVRVSVQIVRTFVRLRETLSTHAELARKLEGLEKKYDGQFKIVFEAIRQLMAPPVKPKRKIGFDLKEKQARYSKKGVRAAGKKKVK